MRSGKSEVGRTQLCELHGESGLSFLGESSSDCGFQPIDVLLPSLVSPQRAVHVDARNSAVSVCTARQALSAVWI